MTLNEQIPGKTGATRKRDQAPVPVQAGGRPIIDTLTGIRAVASVWVVVYHLKEPMFLFFPGLLPLAPPISNGFLTIEIFFVLSGFVIAYNYAERASNGPAYRKYLWARVARIYPIHLLMLLVSIVLYTWLSRADFLHLAASEDFPATVGNVAGNVLMLQAVPGFRAFDGPAWSISCEAAAYLLLPLLAWWALKVTPRAALAWAGVVMVAGVIAMNMIDLPDAQWAISHPLMWLRIATEFTAGVLLWAWWRAKPRGSRGWDVAAVASLVATLGLSYVLKPESPQSLVLLPLMALFVVACASVTGPVATFLASRFMRWAGSLSYSLYMSHLVVFVVVRSLLPWDRLVQAPAIVRAGWLLVLALWVFGTAAVLYYGVEEPGRRWLMRWYRRRQAVADGARHGA